MIALAEAGPTVRRMTQGANEALERLSAGGMANCQTTLIALDAIAEGFGARWPAKRAQVYDHVDRVLTRSLGATGYALRVSPTDFLVVQNDVGEFAAQALCCRCFDELWTHFLGQVPHRVRSVHRVTELDGDEIIAVEIEPAAALAGEAREHEAAARAARVAAEEGRSLLSAQRWTPFVAGDGRRVDVSCRLEPVVNLKTYGRIALRLRRRVIDLADGEALNRQAIAAFSRSDMFRIDMACAARGRSRLLDMSDASDEPALVVPASYISLAHAPSRQTFIGALRELKAVAAKGIIVELHDLAGAPQAGLAEILSILRPECLLVAGYLIDPPGRGLKDLGVQALAVSCPRNLDGEAQFIGWLRDWMRHAHKVSRSVMLYNCDSPRRMALASLLGATHASGELGS